MVTTSVSMAPCTNFCTVPKIKCTTDSVEMAATIKKRTVVEEAVRKMVLA